MYLLLFPFRRNIEHHFPILLGGVPCLCFQGCALSRFELSLVKWRARFLKYHLHHFLRYADSHFSTVRDIASKQKEPGNLSKWKWFSNCNWNVYCLIPLERRFVWVRLQWVTCWNQSSPTEATTGKLPLKLSACAVLRVPRIWTPWRKLHRGWRSWRSCWQTLRLGEEKLVKVKSRQRLFFVLFFLKGETKNSW